MLFYLIRHGRSLANTANLITGTTDDVLSDEGVAQVRALAAWLQKADIKSTRYVTSQWQRAQQTAKILWPEADWRIDTRVGETDAGEAATWPSEKFMAAHPLFFQSNDNRFPGGESHKDLYERVTGWLAEMLAQNDPEQRIVLVAHSGPISCILQYALGMGYDAFPAFAAAPASLSIIRFSPGDPKTPNARAKLLGFSLIPPERLADIIY